MATSDYNGSAFTLRQNMTKNKRKGQTYRVFAGTSKSGVKGNYHVYSTGKRVFVPAKPAPKKGVNRPQKFANSPFYAPGKKSY